MSDALELARCVEINIENMVTIMPVLKMHPLLSVVQLQIKECIAALEAAEHGNVATEGNLENSADGESNTA